MTDSVERILLAIQTREDWLVILEEELNSFERDSTGQDCFAVDILEDVLIIVIKEEFPVCMLEELVRFNRRRANQSFFRASWIKAISGYGNEEAFAFMMQRVTMFGPVGMIYEAAAQAGEKRLLQVLKWLHNSIGYYNAFEHYVIKIDNSPLQSLSSIQKLIIIKGSQSLHIDPFTHGWGKEGGLVENWLASVCNDV